MQISNDFTSFSQLSAKLPQQKLARGLSVLILIYLAWLVSQIIWLFVKPAEKVVTANVVVASTSSNNESVVDDVTRIVKLNLFGKTEPKVKQKPVETKVEDAPETRLNLILAGVVASPDKNVAIAIIANNGQQVTYGIGDKIENTRAVLDRIYFDRVLIKHNGRLETLMLDGVKFQQQVRTQAVPVTRPSTSRVTQRSVDNRDNAYFKENASKIKENILKDPGKITDYLRISPHRAGGEIIGYRLMPGRDAEFFKASGLKAGDIAVQMNGYDLTSPLDAAQAMQGLKTETEVSLWVNRAGEVTEILFSIQN